MGTGAVVSVLVPMVKQFTAQFTQRVGLEVPLARTIHGVAVLGEALVSPHIVVLILHKLYRLVLLLQNRLCHQRARVKSFTSTESMTIERELVATSSVEAGSHDESQRRSLLNGLPY